MKRPSFQFYPGDWMRDSALRSCTVAARGLWMDMLCLMHEGYPYGYLQVGSKVIQPATLARMVGCDEADVVRLLGELEHANVFSRNAEGCIFSRRMVQDEKTRNSRAEGGRKGGNPKLLAGKKVNLIDNHQGYPPPEDEEEDAVSHSSLVQLPPGFPATLGAARGQAEAACATIDPEYVKDVWETLVPVGGKDGSNRQILGFGGYIKRRWEKEQMEWRTKQRAKPAQPVYQRTAADDAPELSPYEILLARRKAEEEAQNADQRS